MGATPVSVCATAAAANIANETAPASAREGWCSVPARKLGANDVEQPEDRERDRRTGAAAKNRARDADGTDTAAGGNAGAATRPVGFQVRTDRSSQDHQATENQEGKRQGVACPLGEHARDQPSEPEPAEVRAAATI